MKLPEIHLFVELIAELADNCVQSVVFNGVLVRNLAIIQARRRFIRLVVLIINIVILDFL